MGIWRRIAGCHDVIASERFPHSQGPASQLALFPVELVATGRAHGPTGTWSAVEQELPFRRFLVFGTLAITTCVH